MIRARPSGAAVVERNSSCESSAVEVEDLAGVSGSIAVTAARSSDSGGATALTRTSKQSTGMACVEREPRSVAAAAAVELGSGMPGPPVQGRVGSTHYVEFE
jgi:hypothetical protein